MLLDSDLEQTRQVMGRLGKHVDEQRIEIPGKEINNTLTIGVTSCLPTDMAIEQPMADADIALYKGKNEGRNRVIVRPRENPSSFPDTHVCRETVEAG